MEEVESTVEDVTPNTSKMGLMESISRLLGSAREQGANPEQMREMRQYFKSQTDWNPTKKQQTLAERKRRRKEQKLSRRANRGTNKGIVCRKGQRFTRAA